MIFDRVKDSILKNKTTKEQGGYTGIPTSFKKLREYIPCTEKGYSIGILGATGSGKSRFTRYMYVYEPYKFFKETGYPIRIFILGLEDNKEKIYRSLICHYLFELYNIYITLQELDSKGDRILPVFVADKIVEAEEFFKEFEKTVTILDGIHTPSAISKYFEQYALSTGKIQSVDIEIEGKIVKQSKYTANNDVHTLIIVDNLSNIDTEEKLPTEREAMTYFCKKIVRERFCNYFNFTVVQVIQQDFATERQSFNRDGNTILAKLEPSLASIGDSKVISRAMHIVYGLFNPSRFDLIQYPIPSKHAPNNCYRLDILGNRFRSLNVLKANDSDFGMKIAFNFDAISEIMSELPRPVEKDGKTANAELEEIYHRIRAKHPDRFAKIKNVTEKKEELNEDEDIEAAPF